MKKSVKRKNCTYEDRISDTKYVWVRQLSGAECRHCTRKKRLIKTSRASKYFCNLFLIPSSKRQLTQLELDSCRTYVDP